MTLPDDNRNSLIRYTSRLVDKLNGLKPGKHCKLAAKMLDRIGIQCELDHVHLYLARLNDGPHISLYSEWSREQTASLKSNLQGVALSLISEQAAEFLPNGAAVYCGVNEQSESCSRLISSILRQLKSAAYELIPILIHRRFCGVIAVAHDKGPTHLDPGCHQLLRLAGRVFVGGYLGSRRESRRRRLHRQWRSVANGACDFAVVLDSAMDVVNVVSFRNPSPPAVRGLRLQDIVTQTSYDAIAKFIAEAIDAKHARTIDFLLIKGSEKPGSYNARVEPDGDTAGNACTLYLTSNDAEHAAAEELAELRVNLAQASRLSVSGNLASEYAHQLAQPLQVIGTQAFTLSRRLKNTEATRQQMEENVREIQEQVEHAREVIFGMRDFLQDRRARLAATELNVIVVHAMKLVQPRPDSGSVKIYVSDDESLLNQTPPLKVHIDRVQTTYVIINLMVNAIEACLEAQTPDPEIVIGVKSHDSSEKHLVVSVSDNGPGLPRCEFEKVFNRFFTTKKSGFGFGLAICRDVVERQRGIIDAKNNSTAGCTFTFSVLRQSEEAEEETRQLEEAAEKMMEQEFDS